MPIPEIIKKRFFQSLYFILGVVVTIIITKYSDIKFPSNKEPIIIKQLADTVQVVHEFKLPDDSSYTHSKEKLKMEKEQIAALRSSIFSIEQIQKDKNITDSIIVALNAKVEQENKQLFKDIYNSEVDVKNCLPKMKGFTQSSDQSTNFIFNRPNVDSTKDFIDLSIGFFNKQLVGKIACISVKVFSYPVINGKKETYYVFDGYYNIKVGTNIIRLKNYLKQKNVRLEVGYFLESEEEKEYPSFANISYSFN